MSTPPAQFPHTWDIFCKVIDNFGDIGVCWRLAQQLTQHRLRVRLWLDDAAALEWMAADALRRDGDQVVVHIWDATAPARWLALMQSDAASDVWVEAFGCDTTNFIAHYDHNASTSAKISLKIAINLEYLSAESFVERTHGLASPVRLVHASAEAVQKWFFYPGFTARTGGLLRESGLMEQQAGFDRTAWLGAQGIDWRGERLVSLFCYDNTALPGLLTQLMEGPERTTLLVTQGKAAAAVRSLLETENFEFLSHMSASYGHSMLSIVYLPLLNQTDFDHLLWSCDLNFVRGEDSLVRALWTGKPFIWQIYPQDDGAHHAKLQAFLDWLEPPAAWLAAFIAWNMGGQLPVLDWPAWQSSALAGRARLLAQDDLCTQLLAFVAEKRLKS